MSAQLIEQLLGSLCHGGVRKSGHLSQRAEGGHYAEQFCRSICRAALALLSPSLSTIRSDLQ